MGRTVARSRGCQPCRKRKIKCDEKQPECSYCLRRGIKCPGAITGTIFIDMSRKLIASTSDDPAGIGDSQSQPESLYREAAGITSEPSLGRIEEDRSVVDNNVTDLTPKAKSMIRRLSSTRNATKTRQQFKLPTTYQPSRAPLFDNLFIMHFIDYYWNDKSSLRRKSWVQFLPEVFASCTSLAVRYSIRAATTATYGYLTKDESIKSNARRWYMLGLERQRMMIQKMKLEGTGTTVDASIIFVALLFVQFEIVMCTQPDAWVPHAIAAEQHLVRMGPQNCRAPMMHHIFLNLRRWSYQVSVFLKRQSPFAADEWCIIPYENIAPNAFDSLLTIILHVPSCQFLYTQLPATSPDSLPLENERAKRVKDTIIANCTEILLKLDDYWVTCNARLNEELIHDPAVIENPQFLPPKDCKQELSALYASARIILNSLLALTSPNCKIQQMYEEQVLRYSATVLSTISLNSESLASVTWRFEVGFTLSVICKYSPCSIQRQEARDVLVRWEPGIDEGTV